MSGLPTQEFFHFRSSSLLAVEGEEDRAVNPGLYGEAFRDFIKTELSKFGFILSRSVCEDWGWWFEVENPIKPIEMGLYSSEPTDGYLEYALSVDVRKASFFKLRAFKKVSRVDDMVRLKSAIQNILSNSTETELIAISEDFPL